jgi:cardiolipin synthase
MPGPESQPPTVEEVRAVVPPAVSQSAPFLALPVTVPVAGHELTLFVESLPLIAALVRDVRAARQRVWLETYIILDDAAGRAVAEVLKDRARAGLDVRLLYDFIGSQTTPAAFFHDLEQAGVKVHCFHSIWEALWKFAPLRILNRRDHRKVVVVDDEIAYFGGMNVVDASSARTVEQAEHLPTSAGWRDVHVRLVGPQQGQVAESFERMWRRAKGKRLTRRPADYRRADLASGTESIQFFDSGPGPKYTRAARIFTRLLRAARRVVTLSMAYFVPVGLVLKALLAAHRRGVRLRVVVPGDSDVPLVQHATRHLYGRLVRKRFRIYERQVNMLHSKVMVVDDEWAVLGSSNLDARSLYINYEFLAVIHSRNLCRVLNEIVEYEIAHSHRVRPGEYRERGCWRRLVNRLAWGLRWWL